MDNDGNLDLVVAFDHDIVSGVAIFLGNGDGTFQGPKFSSINDPGPNALTSQVAGDFNGDGKPDVAVSGDGTENTRTIAIMLGNGDGTLQFAGLPAEYTIIAPASSVAVGDFDGDGKLDLALTYDWSGRTANGQSSYFVFLGNGDGTFQDPIRTQLANGTTPSSIQIADFNGDGILDLAMLGDGNLNPILQLVGGQPMTLIGNGDGTFKAPQSFPFAESALAVGDINGDGFPDLAGPAVLLNTSASSLPASFTLSASPSSLTLA